ncbi:MAG: phospholipase D-like domain-containing protein [Anaerolineales bacterium]
MKKTRLTGLLLALLILLTACLDGGMLTLLPAPETKSSEPPLQNYPNPAESPDRTLPVLTEVTLPAGYGAESSWIDIYFTDPDSPLAAQETGGVDEKLVQAIDSARLTLDIAIYSISLRSVRDAILRAHDRGVQVRMVMESGNRDRSAPQVLEDAGIPILGDRREGLMHNKFVIIDRSEVWLGSMNFTYSGAYDDNNHLVHIRSSKIAENYTAEFEEMFVDDKFGDEIGSATPNPKTTIEGTLVETYFSPDDGVEARILDLLKGAQKSIYFMAFSFTSDPFGSVIREKAASGLTVAGVMEAEQIKSNIGTEYDPFAQASLDVYPDGNEGQMHHKVIVIDEEIVITGSYNFSRSAETRNDENVIIMYSKTIADLFMKEFQKVFEQAQR